MIERNYFQPYSTCAKPIEGFSEYPKKLRFWVVGTRISCHYRTFVQTIGQTLVSAQRGYTLRVLQQSIVGPSHLNALTGQCLRGPQAPSRQVSTQVYILLRYTQQSALVANCNCFMYRMCTYTEHSTQKVAVLAMSNECRVGLKCKS